MRKRPGARAAARLDAYGPKPGSAGRPQPPDVFLGAGAARDSKELRPPELTQAVKGGVPADAGEEEPAEIASAHGQEPTAGPEELLIAGRELDGAPHRRPPRDTGNPQLGQGSQDGRELQ
jgi:hypothetical protein